MKIIISIAVLVVLGGSIFLLTQTSAKQNIRLQTERVSRHSITNDVTATGTVEPVSQVEVGTQVSGKIDKIYVDYNSVVTQGQLIAEMDKVTLQAELRSQEAQLANAKAEYEYQQKNYARSKVLYDKKLISDTDYETSTYNYDKAKAAYDQSQASIVKVRQNLEYATITSPIDGVVINRAVEAGQTVAAGFSTPTLFTIANDLTRMQVIADVDEADIGQVEEGQKAKFTVDAYPNDVFEGDVTQVRLEATVTSNVVTYEVVISAHNPDLKLKPGLTANVTIRTLEHADVLTVPTKSLRFVPDPEALQQIQITVSGTPVELPAGRRTVWRKNGQTLEAKVITVGSASGSRTEVIDGLNEGDEIVVEASVSAALPEEGTTEKSPFMPSRPENNKKK